LVLGEKSVDEAYIDFGPDKIHRLQSVDGYSNLWKYTTQLPGKLIQYKYRILEKASDFNVPILGRIEMLSKVPAYYEEPDERKVESHAQFDVFEFEGEKHYLGETVPESIIFYLKYLLPSVDRSSIMEILTIVESLRFITLDLKYVKECVNWIVERALDCEVTDIQRLFLCIVLSHLNIYGSTLPFRSNDETTDVCDRLLRSLYICTHQLDFRSTNNLECLKKVAIILVKNSSSPGWLTLAAHFYPYLEMTFFLDEKNAKELNHKYDLKEYRKKVNALLSHIKRRKGNDQAANQCLLRSVLKCAPRVDDIWEVFESIDFSLFFTSEDKKVDFFTKFYQETSGNVGEQTNSVGEMLVKFDNIPKKIRGRLRQIFFPILVEFCKSDDEFNEQQEEIFVRLIISETCLSLDEVLQVLLELSKSFSRQNLLLEILDAEQFAPNWHKIQRPQKVKICESWVITRSRVTNKMRDSSLHGVDEIVTIYEALNAIMNCSLNIANKFLVQEVSTNVVEKILKVKEATSVLKAFPNIEKCVIIVQKCYLSLVKKTLVQTPNVAKKSAKFTQDVFSKSRYNVVFLVILQEVHIFKMWCAINTSHATKKLIFP
jgi:hypothetical protein